MIRYIMLFLLFTTSAYSLGLKSASNCGIEYFRYCSEYDVNSNEVRDCFKRNGKNLSQACVDALLADGEVTKEEIDVEKEKIKQEETKPIEEPVKPKEEIPVTSTEPIIIDEKPKIEPATIKSNILQDIARRVAAKLKQTTPKRETIAAKVAEVIKAKPSRSRKVQVGGKWDGFPLYVEWNNGGHREYGGELTLYGYEDRR